MADKNFLTAKQKLLCPSILSANLVNVLQDIATLHNAFDILHLDVMDGSFVPPITFGAQYVADLRKFTDMPFDVHLMVDHPETKVDAFIAAGADILTFHAEATHHPQRLLSYIKDKGCLAGIALNPATPLGSLDYLLTDVDVVLLMTVNPGYGGQSFIPQTMEKISDLKGILQRHEEYAKVRIEVDGGVKTDNIAEISKRGADLLVAGSAIFKATDPYKAALALKKQMS